MGFDSMAAWDKSTFDIESYSSTRNSDYPFNATNARSCSTSSDSRRPPAFRNARALWSPPLSPTSSRPQSRHISPDTSPPLSPRVDSAFHPSPELRPKNKSTLASQMYAASCAGDVRHVELLLSLGAPLNAGTLVMHLYEGFKPAKHGHLSPLSGAASHGQIEAARYLIQLGAQVNPDLTQSSSAPLHQACAADDIDMVRLLLSQGANINTQNCYRTTPLMYAIKYASTHLVELLLSYKPDLSLFSIMGTSAIHWAILQNTRPLRRTILQLLLDAGADVQQRMSDESTPLHCAALAGLTDVAELLLRGGADPGARNGQWQKPREVAAANCYKETVQLLDSWEGQPQTLSQLRSQLD